MPLQDSGQITINQINIEAGRGSGTQASLNDKDIRDMINKAASTQMNMEEWYGASSSYLTYPGDNPVFGQAINDFGSTLGSGSNASGWGSNVSVTPGFANQIYWQAGGTLIPAGTYTLNYTSVSVSGTTGSCRPILFTDNNTGFSNSNRGSTGYGMRNFEPAANIITGTGTMSITSSYDFYFGIDHRRGIPDAHRYELGNNNHLRRD